LQDLKLAISQFGLCIADECGDCCVTIVSCDNEGAKENLEGKRSANAMETCQYPQNPRNENETSQAAG